MAAMQRALAARPACCCTAGISVPSPRARPLRRAPRPCRASPPDGPAAPPPGAWPWRSPDWRALQAAVPPTAREAERSALVNEEIVYFIFQLELDSQLQRALNYEAYDAAQKVRAKRESVDMAIRALQARKGGGAGGAGAGAGGAGAPGDQIDLATQGLQLRGEMQRAVEEERYADAARLRDALSELERRSKQAAAAAREGAGDAGRLLRLGQRVVHRRAGFRGAVVGWDAACCEGEDWVAASGAAGLPGGLQQPFYHVLVDVRDWRFDAAQPPVAYVAQELLAAPELADDGTSWAEVYGEEGGDFQHPYCYILFLGPDARGDLLPCRQLRDKYSQPRRDVPHPGDGGGEGGGGEGGGGGSGGGGGGPRIPGIDMSSLL